MPRTTREIHHTETTTIRYPRSELLELLGLDPADDITVHWDSKYDPGDYMDRGEPELVITRRDK